MPLTKATLFSIWPWLSLGFRQKRKPNCADKDRDVGNVKGVGVIKTATSHVEKVGDSAINDAVDDIAQSATYQKATSHVSQSGAARSVQPDQNAHGDGERHADKHPAHIKIGEESEVHAAVPSHPKLNEPGKHGNPTFNCAWQIKPLDNRPFRRLIDDENPKRCPIEKSHVWLVPEVAHACKDHGDTCLIGGGDHLIIAHGATGLDHAGRACGGCFHQTVGKGEEGIGCNG